MGGMPSTPALDREDPGPTEAPSAHDAPPDWRGIAPESIVERLSARRLLGADEARAIRDRAAALVLADPSQAMAIATALERTTRRSEPAVRAHALRSLAEASMYSGKIEAAREAYAAACAVAEAAHDSAILGQILVGRVHALSLAGAAAEATRLARRTERLLTKNGDDVYLAKLHLNRGNGFYQRERHAEARASYARAARIFEALGLRDATWTVLRMNQAIAATNLGLLDEARELFLEIERDAEAGELDYAVAHAQYNRAFLERSAGDYRTALALLTRAGDAFEPLGAADMSAAAERARAEIYLELGMAEEARDLARTAAAQFEREGMRLDRMIARHDEGRALLLLREFDAATACLGEVEAEFRVRRIRLRHAAARLDQARLAREAGRPAEGEKLARRALAAFTREGVERRAVEARLEAVESILARGLTAGRLAAARALLSPALARAARVSLGERRALFALAGRVELEAEKPRSAARLLRKAASLLEAERQLIPGVDLRARAFATRVAVYHDLIALALRAPSPRVEELARLTEAARARGFREREAGLGTKPRTLLAKGRAQLGTFTRQLEEAEFGDKPPQHRREIERRTRALERELTSRLLRQQGLDSRDAMAAGRESLARARRLLDAHDLLLSFFVTQGRVLVLAARAASWGPSGASSELLAQGAEEIANRIERVRFQLDALSLDGGTVPPPNLPFLRRAAEAALRSLYDAILRPLERWMEGVTRLLVVPHGLLHAAPFEALHDGERYLDERAAVLRLPSISALRRPRASAPRPQTEALLAGLTEAGPHFVAAELDAVASCFARREVRLLRDPSSEELLNALPRARLIHLVTHGVFRDDNPTFSRLSLRGGALFLADLEGHSLGAELVVLSACNSGRVFAGQGDDLSSVAHGFLAAGARQLVASHWRVHDRATRELMEHFYHAYRGTEDAAIALAAAQRRLRADWDHPFYWGAFTAHGLSSKVVVR